MAFSPISAVPIQYVKADGTPANGYYIKFYLANSSTPISMQTDSGGATSIAKAKLNESGYPISNPNDENTVFIPHLSTTYTAYRFVLYASAADADANNVTAGLPNIQSVEINPAISATDDLRADLAANSGSSLVGFLQDGTGAVARTAQDKMREFVSVLDFGAVGDGVNDDTTAFQQAIDYVQGNMVINTSTSPYSGTQVLMVPDGYFKITNTLYITKAISIIGSKSSEFSTGARLFKTTSGDLFNFSAAGGGLSFSVERLSMKSTVSGTGHLINVQPGSPGYNSWRVLDCCFSNPQDMSIRVTGDDIQILNNTFDVSGYSGNSIQLGSNTAGDKASNVRIESNNFFNIPVRCVLLFNAQTVMVNDNVVSQPDASSKTIAFVDALDSAPTLCNGVTVSGNTLYGVSRIAAGNNCNYFSFTDNTGYNCGTGATEAYDMLRFSGTCNNININGNSINGSYGARSAFYNGGTLTNVNVNGNIFSGSSTGTALVCGTMTGQVSANAITGWTEKITASDYYALGYRNGDTQVPAYGTTINIDATAGEYILILVTNGAGFTINAPTKPSDGQIITIQVYNNSGGATGVITWDAVFKKSAFTSPASGYSRMISFAYSSGLAKWTEVSSSQSDIPN